MEVVVRATDHLHRCAIRVGTRAWRYNDILRASLDVSEKLPRRPAGTWPSRNRNEWSAAQVDASRQATPWFLGHHSWPLDCGDRVALLARPGASFTAAAWGTWAQGHTLVPLALSHPRRELDYVMSDASPSAIVADNEHAELASDLARAHGVHFVEVPEPPSDTPILASEELSVAQAFLREAFARAGGPTPDGGAGSLSDSPGGPPTADVGALIIYTSGTTGRPKGVLHTHASLSAQAASLSEAWDITGGDTIAHLLPMHHIHGIVNAWITPHLRGACVDFLSPKFTAPAAWEMLAERDVSVLMGVPTMYALLLSHLEQLRASGAAEHEAFSAAARRLRLAVSGSAACPVPVMERWGDLTGSYLLERYGMTEIGMAIGNPLVGERRPGSVGSPLPYCEVATAEDLGVGAGEGGGMSGASGRGEDGDVEGVGSEDGSEILVRGPCLFREYWQRPETTAEAFVETGEGMPWFRTGDTGARRGDPERYVILGRTSVDVIKSRGYKLSALGIESAILEHPKVAEAAVVGMPDQEQGQIVTAVIALKDGVQGLRLTELRSGLKDKLPRYALPERLEVVDAIPRNAMGKVNKKELAKSLEKDKVA